MGKVTNFRILLFACFCSLVTSHWSLSAFAADLTAHGYYRTRGVALEEIDLQKSKSSLAHNNHRVGLITYNQMRFRIEPAFKLNDNISLHGSMDILDNVAFGSKNTQQIEVHNPIVGTVNMPAGPSSISMVGGNAGENEAINIRRFWMDILTPVGGLRIGRQPSHWGLGIFQNDGNERQGDFGDSVDRVMFMTQYEFENKGALTGGLAWDIAFEAQYDPRIEGFAGAIRSNGQNTQQYAAFLLYDQPEMTFGAFGGVRRRSGGSGTTTTVVNAFDNNVAAGIDGYTLVYFIDAYGRYSLSTEKYGDYDFKAEYVYIGGKISTGAAINAIPFSAYFGDPNPTTTTAGIIQLPAKQDMAVNMAAFEVSGAYKWGGEWNLKSGFAQGDASPLSQRITQYGFRQDYQVALLMFNYPMGTSPQLWGCNATNGPACATTSKLTGGVPITANYINNAIYASTGYQHHFDVSSAIKKCSDLSIGGRVTTAWADKNPVDLNFQTLLSDTTLPDLVNSGKWYGVEFDITAEAEFFDHLYTALEAGVLMPGAAYNIKVNDNVLGNLVETIPYSKATWAYGGRLTLMVEF